MTDCWDIVGPCSTISPKHVPIKQRGNITDRVRFGLPKTGPSTFEITQFVSGELVSRQAAIQRAN